MILVIIAHIFLLLLCYILKKVGVDDATTGALFTASSTFILLINIFSIKNFDNILKIIIAIGLIARLVLTFTDTNIIRLPDTGTDDDNFYKASLTIYDSYQTGIKAEKVYGGLYSKLLSVLYIFIGSNRFAAQYINVALSTIAIIILAKALINYRAKDKKIRTITLLLAFMPYSLIINSILRRESIMEFFICISIYFVIKWHAEKRNSHAIIAILSCAMASLFHTALLFGVPLLIIYFTLYDKRKNEISFSIFKSWKAIIVLSCALVIGLLFLGSYSNKFSSITGADDIYIEASRSRGGSAYLTGYKITNTRQLLLFTPLKFFYFILSPVPWNFRSIADILAFTLDSLVYLCLLVFIFKNNKNSLSKLYLMLFLVLSVIYALGTFTSGTAIRHRLTLLPFLLVAYYSAKHKEKVIGNEKKVRII